MTPCSSENWLFNIKMAYLQTSNYYTYKMALDKSFQFNMPTKLNNTHVHMCIFVGERSSDHRSMVAGRQKCRPIVVRLSVEGRPMIDRYKTKVFQICAYFNVHARRRPI